MCQTIRQQDIADQVTKSAMSKLHALDDLASNVSTVNEMNPFSSTLLTAVMHAVATAAASSPWCVLCPVLCSRP